MTRTNVFSRDDHEPLLSSTSEELKPEFEDNEDVRDTQSCATSKLAIAILLTSVCPLIIVLTTFHYLYPHTPNESNESTLNAAYNTSQEYVILASDSNLHYVLTIPFAVQHWRNLNVSSIVMLCGTEAEYANNRATREVVAELQRLGAVVLYFKNNTLKSNNFAQNMRNFAAATSFVQRHPSNSTILITSDVDYFPFRKEDHFPDVRHGMRIVVFNPDCWILPNDIATGEYMEAKTNQMFDGQLDQYLHKINWLWYLDQRLFGLQFYRLMQKHPEYEKLISGHSLKKRIGRGLTPEEISKIDIREYDDAHISPAIYNETIWRTNRVFFRKIFSEDQAILLENYRNRAVKFVNATEIAERHFHPG
ncbi:unnamed protein product [Bursaphelenchus xylophilus]|uniref:(pine wood nematode) hypothetical protein n=1 Tax=Bursaphelenchus xylophilus TaxID=6326 RepID=A0A1I7SEF0_BURXY|nr:unnamed protein product [Bursaphelenchus xylophilus]CAG9104018.1 unnamed protein product [Bursaphelenchus xylophilus]